MTKEELGALLLERGYTLAAQHWFELGAQREPGLWDLLQDMRGGHLFARHQDRPCESWVFRPDENTGDWDDPGWQPWDLAQ